MADLSSGVRDLRRVQLGVEQYGYATPVTPTAQLVGMLDGVEDRNRVFVDEATGIMSAHRRTYDASVIANLSYDAGTEGATFEQLIYLLSMALKGDVIPTALGGGAYRWRYTPDLTNGDTPEIYTVRWGDNRYCWQAEGVCARSMSLGAESQAAWTLAAELFGDQKAPSAFADISYPTPLETILGQMTTIYIDDTWGGLGTNQLQGTLIGWGLEVPSFHDKFFQDGQLPPSGYGLASRALTLTLNFEFNANAVAEWLLARAGTMRFMRLQATGSIISGVQAKTVTIDLAGVYQSPDEALGERDGNDTLPLTLITVQDDEDSGMEWQMEVINTIDVYP